MIHQIRGDCSLHAIPHENFSHEIQKVIFLFAFRNSRDPIFKREGGDWRRRYPPTYAPLAHDSEGVHALEAHLDRRNRWTFPECYSSQSSTTVDCPARICTAQVRAEVRIGSWYDQLGQTSCVLQLTREPYVPVREVMTPPLLGFLQTHHDSYGPDVYLAPPRSTHQDLGGAIGVRHPPIRVFGGR